MTGDELRAARHHLGLTQDQMAHVLGYVGAHRRGQIDDMETGYRPIRDAQRRLVQAYLDGYRPADWRNQA